ncbi:MAG: glutathione S-transferase family protein [Myxococcota bacterium]|nr:glutathione S-transferase family protein [Myxococcota bacterium]
MATLHTTARSANGRKPLALVHHLDLAVEVREVDVYAGAGRDPAYLAVNPSGQVPTLIDGDLVLPESNAILIYLAEREPGAPLWSEDPARRAVIASWLFFEAAQWQPALVPVLSAHVAHRLLPDAMPEPDAPPDWEEPRLAGCLSRLESHLAGREWMCGDGPSLADLSLAGMTTYFACTGFPSARHPALAAWIARVESLPAWQATAHPDFA